MDENDVLRFGVCISNSIVEVFENNDKENESYDICLMDRVVRNYNGNVSYSVELVDNCKSDFLDNGWKFCSLYFPGNWRGQNAHFELQDKYGHPFTSDKIITERWYRQQPLFFVKEALQSAIYFSHINHSVKYHHIVSGKTISPLITEKIKYAEFVETIEQYVYDYQEVLLSLISEKASLQFVDKLKMSFCENAKKIFLSNLLNNSNNKQST